MAVRKQAEAVDMHLVRWSANLCSNLVLCLRKQQQLDGVLVGAVSYSKSNGMRLLVERLGGAIENPVFALHNSLVRAT